MKHIQKGKHGETLETGGFDEEKGVEGTQTFKQYKEEKNKQVNVGYSRFYLELSHAKCQLLLLAN